MPHSVCECLSLKYISSFSKHENWMVWKLHLWDAICTIYIFKSWVFVNWSHRQLHVLLLPDGWDRIPCITLHLSSLSATLFAYQLK